MINTCNSEIQCIVLLHDHEMSTLIYLKVKKHFEGLKKSHQWFSKKESGFTQIWKTQTLDISIGIFACERTSFCILSIQYEIGIMALHIGIGSLGTDKILGL